MDSASSAGTVGAEASAACSITLFGGAFGFLPPSARPEDALSIAVALDRRPFARAEADRDAVVVESKDALLKVEASAVADLSPEGLVGLVRSVLLGLKVERGLRVAVQARVPLGAGLGSAGALAVALAAAGARQRGDTLSAEALAAFALRGEMFAPVLPAAGFAAVWGGAVAADVGLPGAAPERLRVDPARLEECLLLVDLGASAPTAGSGPQAAANSASASGFPSPVAVPSGAVDDGARIARQGREALRARRYAELPALLAAELQTWRACAGPLGEPFERLAAVVGPAGGVAIPCGRAAASLALVWAAPGARGPGPREDVQRALKGAAFRTFPCRVDLRGLELEDV